MRLDKYIADALAASRKSARHLAVSGNVRVNGMIVKDPGYIVSEEDSVEISGKKTEHKKYVYLMMNKPKGCLSAREDSRDKTVLDYVGDEHARRKLSPAGRLDRDSEGLLILTDDGELIHDIISPKNHMPKVYLVVAEGSTKQDLAGEFARGVKLEDGYVTMPAQLEFYGAASHVSYKVTLHEGKFHQIKRMFKAFGLKVVYLKRISIGGVELDLSLAPGQYRDLDETELARLKNREYIVI